MMRVGILFPNNETSRFLGIRLLESGIGVKFLCPQQLDEDVAKDIIADLEIVGKEQDTLQGREKSFEVTKHDLFDCRVLGKESL